MQQIISQTPGVILSWFHWLQNEEKVSHIVQIVLLWTLLHNILLSN